MGTRLILMAIATAAVAGCGTSPTVQAPPPDPYPGASERLLDKENCPDADPDGEGLLHDPENGSEQAVLEARRKNGRMYLECRETFHDLVDHERDRMRYLRERAMEQSD